MSKVSVLVVDDATFIRDLVKKGLRDNFPGVQIEEAINGRKAQQMLSRQVVDLILCDWEMPEMSGLELLTWCREQPQLKAMPFVMVTSRGDKENVVQAIQAGVSGYVSKPFTNEQLLTKVKQALNKVGKLDTLMNSAPTKMNSAFGNDSLSALTGGKPAVVGGAAARPAAAATAPARALLATPLPPSRAMNSKCKSNTSSALTGSPCFAHTSITALKVVTVGLIGDAINLSRTAKARSVAYGSELRA